MTMQVDSTPSTGTRPPALSWKTQNLIIGALIGLALGLLAAYLYVRAAGENNRIAGPKKMETMDVLKLGLAALGLIRQIAEIGGK